MPRANRYFLPGHIWHIIITTALSSNRSKRSTAALPHLSVGFKPCKPFNRHAPFKPSQEI